MDQVLGLLSLFAGGRTLAQAAEDFTSAKYSTAGKNIRKPTEDDLHRALKLYPPNDTIHLSVRMEELDPVSLHSGELDSLRHFLKELDGVIAACNEESPFLVDLTIEKEKAAPSINIYSLDLVIDGLTSASLADVLHRFNEVFLGHSTLTFRLLQQVESFRTSTAYFERASSRSETITESIDRDKLLQRRADICHFENASQIMLIPEDFHLLKRPSDQRLGILLDKLSSLLSIIFIADITSLNPPDRLSYKLNGYKSINGNIDWRTVSCGPTDELFQIYTWIYQGGSITDKVGLARNLISLHVRAENLLNLDSGLYRSICSGYEIYLKQNIKQYIDLKNKLIEFLNDFGSKASRVGENLGDTLQKNFIGLLTFFVSVILLKVISQNDFSIHFTKGLEIISFGLLTASFIHLVVSFLMVNKETTRLKESYESLRHRYDDILDPQDLKNIFAGNSEYDRIIKFTEFKRNLFAGAWLLYILILGAVVLLLGKEVPPLSTSSSTNPPPTLTATNSSAPTKLAPTVSPVPH